MEVIKATSTYVIEHESEFIQKVRSATELQRESEAKALKNFHYPTQQYYVARINIFLPMQYELPGSPFFAPGIGKVTNTAP